MSSRLRELIRAVRQSKTAQEERDVVAKESAALRQAFKDQDVHYRHRNVAKLMYIHMLGYPTHFGQMETLKLIASNGFPEKRIGYLGLMILLDERQEVLMLVTNSIKQDLNQRNQYIAGLALTALGNISSTDMARDLAPDIERMLGANNAYIRKKAALCACRILRKVPELLDQFMDKAASLLQDRHHGVLLTGVTLMLDICEIHPAAIEHYREHVPMLCKILKSLLMSGFAPEHDVGGITDPFLQVKVLRLLRLLGKGSAEASDQMSDILAQVASNTESNRNAGNAILYECVQTIMENESITGLRVLAINILGRFLTNRDNNIRYVALETLAKVVAVDTVAVQRHRNTVVECVKDADISIRRRALDLVYALVNENNIKTLTKELLDYLQVCDAEFKPDLTSKICMLIQRYAPDKRWYVDSLTQVLVQAGTYVKEEAVRAFVVMVSNATDLQGYATRQLYAAVLSSIQTAGESLKIAALWCIGEYGEQIVNNINPMEGEELHNTTADDLVSMIEAVLHLQSLTAKVKEYALTALIKLSARLPSQSERIKQDINVNNRSIQLEVQQRACEFSRMFSYQNRAQLVEHIPALDETTYSQNLTSQAVVDSAAPVPTAEAVANGTAVPAGAPTVDLLDLLSLDDGPPAAAPPSGLADLLGGAPAAAPAAVAAPAPVVDLLGDLFGGATPSPAPVGPLAASGLDVLGALTGAAPAVPSPAAPCIQAFDKNGIRIMFELTKPGPPTQTDIKAVATNSTGSTISDFSLQAAVPKFMQLKLDPATSNVLPPSGTVTQVLHINNSMHGQKPLVMRLRVSYNANGNQLVEQGEVNSFPPGY